MQEDIETRVNYLEKLNAKDGEHLENSLSKLKPFALNELLKPLHLCNNSSINKDWLFVKVFTQINDLKYLEYGIKHLASKLNKIPENKLSVSVIDMLYNKISCDYKGYLKQEIKDIAQFINKHRRNKNVAELKIDDHELLNYEVLSKRNVKWILNEIHTLNEERGDIGFEQWFGKHGQYPFRASSGELLPTYRLNLTLADIQNTLKNINIEPFSFICIDDKHDAKIPFFEGIYGWGSRFEIGLFVSVLDKRINHIWIDYPFTCEILGNEALNEMTAALNLLGTELNLIIVDWMSEEIIDLSNSVEVRNFLMS